MAYGWLESTFPGACFFGRMPGGGWLMQTWPDVWRGWGAKTAEVDSEVARSTKGTLRLSGRCS